MFLISTNLFFISIKKNIILDPDNLDKNKMTACNSSKLSHKIQNKVNTLKINRNNLKSYF